MSDSQFLVARIPLATALAPGGVEWFAASGAPFAPTDPVDFSTGDLPRVFALYQRTYGRFSAASTGGAKLNVPSAEALFEYTRFVLIVDPAGAIVGFVLAKATKYGVKLCATGSDNSAAAKKAVVALHIAALNTDGVYAEVSGPMEAKLGTAVPTVSATKARPILAGKKITPDADGEHYTREIANIGRHRKKMVGRPR